MRNVAKKSVAKSIVVYLDTSLNIIKERESNNSITGERHKVEPENFQTVLEQLEPPTNDENVIVFKPETNLEEWLKGLEAIS